MMDLSIVINISQFFQWLADIVLSKGNNNKDMKMGILH